MRVVTFLICLFVTAVTAANFQQFPVASGGFGEWELTIPTQCAPCCNSTSEFVVSSGTVGGGRAWVSATGPWQAAAGPGTARLWCDGEVLREELINSGSIDWDLFHSYTVVKSSCSISICGENPQVSGVNSLVVLVAPNSNSQLLVEH
jgi:hypothetical protein